MLCHWCVPFIAGVTLVFSHSNFYFPFGFADILFFTLGASDQIYKVFCSTMAPKPSLVPVVGVRASKYFRFLHMCAIFALTFLYSPQFDFVVSDHIVLVFLC